MEDTYEEITDEMLCPTAATKGPAIVGPIADSSFSVYEFDPLKQSDSVVRPPVPPRRRVNSGSVIRELLRSTDSPTAKLVRIHTHCKQLEEDVAKLGVNVENIIMEYNDFESNPEYIAGTRRRDRLRRELSELYKLLQKIESEKQAFDSPIRYPPMMKPPSPQSQSTASLNSNTPKPQERQCPIPPAKSVASDGDGLNGPDTMGAVVNGATILAIEPTATKACELRVRAFSAFRACKAFKAFGIPKIR